MIMFPRQAKKMKRLYDNVAIHQLHTKIHDSTNTMVTTRSGTVLAPVAAMKKKRAAVKTNLWAAVDELERSRDTISTNTAASEELQRRVQELQEELRSLKENNKSCEYGESYVADLETENAWLNRVAEKMDAEITRLRTASVRSDMERREAAVISEQRNEYAAEIAHARTRIGELESRLEKVERELESVRADNARLQMENLALAEAANNAAASSSSATHAHVHAHAHPVRIESANAHADTAMAEYLQGDLSFEEAKLRFRLEMLKR
jgi:chromosome segregation ATPase